MSATVMHDIETGKYGAGKELYSLNNKSTARWTDEEEKQLEKLFNETEKNPEIDWVAGIMARLDNEDFTRRQVSNQMLKMGLCSREDLTSIKKKVMFVWKDSYVNELKTLFEEFNGKSENVIDEIRSNMSIKPLPSKNKIIGKMVELNLIPDRSAVMKRRGKSAGKSGEISENTELPGQFKSKQFISESEESDDDADFGNTPGLPALEFKVLENGKSVSENLIKFLISELNSSVEDKDEDEDEDDESYEHVILPDNSDIGKEIKEKDIFLKSLGLRPPGDQHVTWKVPGKLNVKRVVKMLEKILDRRNDNNGDNDKTENSEEVLMTEHNSKKQRKVTIFSDSDSDDEIPKIQKRPVSKQTEPEILVTEQQQVSNNSIDDYSEDEMVMRSDSEPEETSKTNNNNNNSDDDDILQPTKKMKISKITFSSDSE